jgi:hypothetical protein
MDLSWYGFERGHLVLGRGHRRVWRSPGLYSGPHFDDVGPIVFGRRRLAFDYSRRVGEVRRLYIAGYRSSKRLLGRGERPLQFLGSGELLTLREGGGALLLRAPRGRIERVVARHVADAQVDRRNGSLVVRTRLRVSVFDGGRLRQLVDLHRLGFKGLPVIEPLGRAIAIHDLRRLLIVDHRGHTLASSRLPRRREPADGVSSSVATNATGTAYAFTAIHGVTAHGLDPREAIYVLHPGERQARTIFDERVSLKGCGRTANLSWNGRWLLYSTTEGHAAVVDSSLGEKTIHLDEVVAQLTRMRTNGEFAISWARE